MFLLQPVLLEIRDTCGSKFLYPMRDGIDRSLYVHESMVEEILHQSSHAIVHEYAVDTTSTVHFTWRIDHHLAPSGC